MWNKLFFILVRAGFAITFILITLLAYSQPGDPGGDPDAPVPISGIGILIALGVSFGLKKIVENKKR